MRDHQSTSCVGTLQSVQSFAPLLRQEARRRGVGKARKIVFIGDGAAWIWELARTHIPLAILILDFYHMMEYLHELSQLLHGKDTPWAGRMKDQWKEQMQKDEVQAVIDGLNKKVAQLGETSADTLEKIHEGIRYLENTKDKMMYGTFRMQGLFYGSGVVEAGCKAVVGKRLKQSGMYWSESGAENILALRCALMGNRWDECWNKSTIRASSKPRPPHEEPRWLQIRLTLIRVAGFSSCLHAAMLSCLARPCKQRKERQPEDNASQLSVERDCAESQSQQYRWHALTPNLLRLVLRTQPRSWPTARFTDNLWMHWAEDIPRSALPNTPCNARRP